jgi:NAD(P)-dependent dehydrogenase (short-subunit alcohol dehydrogenase family)
MSRRYLQPPPEPGLPSTLPRSAETPLLGGRITVVTGAALGIGAGIARALGYHGARLILVDTDEPALAATAAGVASYAEPPVTLVADVTAPATPQRVRAIADDLGGADILVNNVGDFRPAGTFLDSGPRVWDRMYALNFGHVLAMTHALLPGMVTRGRGNVLNVSSVEGLRGIPDNAVYGAMKAAVVSFTASLAAEVGQHGVRVNALAPDFTDTPQTPMWASTDERYTDHVGKWVPAGRFGHPRDHGDAAVFLVSDQSAFVTGSTLRVDGGTLAAPGWFRRDSGRFTNLPRPLG